MNTNNDKGATNVANDTPAALLPCPCCGKADLDRWPCAWLDATGENVVRCAWCHCAAPLKTWNRRASTAPVASESRGSVPDEIAGRVHDEIMRLDGGVRRWEQMGEWQRSAWRKGLSILAPTPPAVANGEPPDWAIAQAVREYYALPITMRPKEGWMHTRAHELARSAAAKGEGQEKPR